MTAKFAGGFCFGLNVRVVDIFLGFGFAHIDSVVGFHNEVRLILLCSARPVYVKLIRHRTNPFKDFIVGFEYEREIKLGRAVETIFGIVGFFEANIHKFNNGGFLSRYRLVKIHCAPVVNNNRLIEDFGKWEYLVDFERSRNNAVMYFHLFVDVIGKILPVSMNSLVQLIISNAGCIIPDSGNSLIDELIKQVRNFIIIYIVEVNKRGNQLLHCRTLRASRLSGKYLKVGGIMQSLTDYFTMKLIKVVSVCSVEVEVIEYGFYFLLFHNNAWYFNDILFIVFNYNVYNFVNLSNLFGCVLFRE